MKSDKSGLSQLLQGKGAFSSLSSSAITRNNESKVTILQHNRSNSNIASKSPTRLIKASSPVPLKNPKSRVEISPKLKAKTQKITAKTERKIHHSESFVLAHIKKEKTKEKTRDTPSPNSRSLSSQAKIDQSALLYQNEITKLKIELEKAKKTIDNLRQNSRNLMNEKENLLIQMEKSFNLNDVYKKQLKSIAGVLVEVVGVFAGNRPEWIYDGDMRDYEKVDILNGIRKALIEQLEWVNKSGIDVADELVSAKS